jgi:hypothetical protein
MKTPFLKVFATTLLIAWLSPAASALAEAETVVTYALHKESKLTDPQYIYVFNLLEEALERTEDTHGPARLVRHEEMIHKARQEGELARPGGDREVDVIYNSSSLEREEKLWPVRIPLLKGILGYRIFLIREGDQEKLAQVQTLEELKQYSIGQGKNWADVEILEHNGFEVVKGDTKTLHRMLAGGRFDLFSRGINEAPQEYDENVGELPELRVEENLLIYYPFVRYFFFAKDDEALAARVEEGLNRLIADGTFDQMFNDYTEGFLSKVDLKNRKLFKLENPFVGNDIPTNQVAYWFDPMK